MRTQLRTLIYIARGGCARAGVSVFVFAFCSEEEETALQICMTELRSNIVICGDTFNVYISAVNEYAMF
jgi:hypothetical protein